MRSERDFRAKEIARLQLELASASQRLEVLERRSQLRARNTAEWVFAEALPVAPPPDMPELRFAANVASGMTKLHAS